MPVSFTPSAARRIAAVVKRVEQMPQHKGGNNGSALPLPLMSFWAKITNWQIIVGSPNRWKYSWAEQERTAAGFQDRAEGRTGNYTLNWALNSVEAYNAELGIQGNGIDHNTTYYPEGWHMQPVRGNPVVRMYIDFAQDGTVYYTFEAVNAEEGTC